MPIERNIINIIIIDKCQMLGMKILMIIKKSIYNNLGMIFMNFKKNLILI